MLHYQPNPETDIAYKMEGKANPLIFIHGLGANHSLFASQCEYFSKTHQVISQALKSI